LEQASWPTPPTGAPARDARHRAASEKEASMQIRSVGLGPALVLTTALDERFTSRGAADFGGWVPSAMRLGFGGHQEPKS
jgi:6-phosphogluconate dehydrogenase (decarboxylating)